MMARGKFHVMHAVCVFDDQLAAVVSSGCEKNNVAERSVRIRCPVVTDLPDRIVHVRAEGLSALIAIEQRREDTREGSAAEINNGFRSSAARIVFAQFARGRDGFRATACCPWLRADWWPAVTLPSTHSAWSRICRASGHLLRGQHFGYGKQQLGFPFAPQNLKVMPSSAERAAPGTMCAG